MSTPGVTAGVTAGVTSKAEVVKKNSLRYSPRHMEPSHKLYDQGFTYAAIDVASGAVVQGFTNEADCNAFCVEQNSK